LDSLHGVLGTCGVLANTWWAYGIKRVDRTEQQVEVNMGNYGTLQLQQTTPRQDIQAINAASREDLTTNSINSSTYVGEMS
jgi:hypothetical protein